MPPGSAVMSKSRPVWTDPELVKECLRGDEEAWSALIDKYKRLIFSIPVKYGFSRDDATEIFQAVCVELLSELPNLRQAKALPKWIMQVAAHKCFHHKRQMQRTEARDPDDESLDAGVRAHAEGIFREAEEEQTLRNAISDLPPRCRQLIQMLFFEEPPRPYEQLAAELGLSTGSIGFIRQRCLERLRKRLTETGF
ncbi:MAG TPA: sigma-70 family RNA polymerase sigma factor [Candidatus Sulfotelmatobacter sp.]|nr:sigma-70 family RNA polymerase sigma factor [Candidatus Sulfotelmatobacter sp.]